MIRMLLLGVAALVASPVTAQPASTASARVLTTAQLGGVNLSGCEFNIRMCPRAADVAFYADAGATVLRIPVKADRLTTDTRLAELKALVETGTSRGLVMIIDRHDYGLIDAPDQVALWTRVAALFPANDLVWFDLMNEPTGGTWDTWAPRTNALIGKLRAAGVTNTLLVEYRQSSGASRFDKRESRSRNCASAACSIDRAGGLHDPLGKTIVSPHRYFDATGAGTSTYCRADLTPGGALGIATVGARLRKLKMWLGEFGFGRAAGMTGACARLAPQIMAYLRANADVWVGWTAWGGGRAWSPTYTFRVENSRDRAATWDSANGRVLREGWAR